MKTVLLGIIFIWCATAIFAQKIKTAETMNAEWTISDTSDVENAGHRAFYSPTIKREASYFALLPPGYAADAKRRFPVLYYLHGKNKTARDSARLAKRFERAMKNDLCPAMIVVFVNGLPQSYYADSFDGKQPVETLIVKDLLADVDRAFRTDARRTRRAIEGFSMGASGALNIGLKFAEKFGVISALASGLYDENSIARQQPEIFKTVFGADKTNFAAWDVWRQLERHADKIRGKTLLRIVIGDAEDDWRIERNREFGRSLERLKISHDFAVVKNVEHDDEQLYAAMGNDNFEFFKRAFADQNK